MEKNDPAEVRSIYHSRIRTEVLRLVPPGSHKVLDIGGGTGASSSYLKSIGNCSYAVVVDLVAESSLPEIDASYGGDLDDPTLLETIATEQGAVDVILCLDVLEHLKDPWSVVKSCHRMLKPEGVMIASIPNVRNYNLVLPLVFKGKFQLTERGILDRTHLRWFEKNSAKDLMTCSGLKIDYIEGKIYGWKKNALNILTFGIFRHFLYIQYFIRVRR